MVRARGQTGFLLLLVLLLLVQILLGVEGVSVEVLQDFLFYLLFEFTRNVSLTNSF